jgi:hypothetical protein
MSDKKYKIESGVPMLTKSKWPFREMNLDDSFAVSQNEVASLRSAAYAFMQRNPTWKLAVHTNSGGGARCWRVK